MGPLWYDRLAGEAAPQPEQERTLMGRWLITPPPHADVRLNSVRVLSGDYLTPGPSGRWRISGQDVLPMDGVVASSQQPQGDEADGVRAIGASLTSLMDARGDWLEWAKIVPLNPDISKILDLTPLDEFIRRRHGYLREVCMRPRTHLHVEIERVPVGKARRLPKKAAPYLLSHTEDWEGPRLRTVMPKRILAEMPDDQMDIYENRVAARLVDHVVEYLSDRMRWTKRQLAAFQARENHSGDIGGTIERRRRVCSLWGQSLDAAEGRQRARNTLRTLEWLMCEVRGLMDSPLYRNVPSRTQIPPALRMTNIFSNDQHYRRVAELWLKLVETGHIKVEDSAEVHQQEQALCHGMARFAMLAIIRALGQLGYDPCEEDRKKPIAPPMQWNLEGHGIKVRCSWGEDGVVQIEAGGRVLALVTIVMGLGSGGDEEKIKANIGRIAAAAGRRRGHVAVLFAGASDGLGAALSLEVRRQLCTVGNDPRTGVPGSVGFLPISTWDIASVERISRALRWFLDGARFDDYPQAIAVSGDIRGLLDDSSARGWLEFRANGQLVMLRAPTGYEWNRLRLEDRVRERRECHQRNIDEHERWTESLRGASRRRAGTGALNAEKRRANQRCVESERALAVAEMLHERLVEAKHKTETLLACPVCEDVVDSAMDFKPRGKGCFLCKCRNCSTEWGTRLCSNGHRYATMLPRGAMELRDATPDWEDRWYGSDLLALPARAPNGDIGFVCPVCGEVT